LENKNQTRVKIPKSFYNTWNIELGKAVILEDDYGNIFAVEIDVITINNKVSAYFNNGMNTLKDFYQIEVGLVHFKYVGQGTFKIRFSIAPIGVSRPQLESTSRIQRGTRRNVMGK